MSTSLYGVRRSSGRPVALAATIGLHVVGFIVFTSTGGLQRLLDEPPVLTARIIDPVKPTPPPELPSFQPASVPVDARIAMPPLAFDSPADEVAAPGAPVGRIGELPAGEGISAGAGTAASPPVVTPLSWTARRSPNDLYPPASIRMGEEGAAIVNVCVGPDGRLAGPPRVTESSGHPRLDAAAIAWTREALVYRAATSNGVPVEACKGFRVTFDLR